MISNIIQISDISVKEIMVPRIDVISIELNSNLQEIIMIVNEKGYSISQRIRKNVETPGRE